MPQNEISAWLQFALQQTAAESYLDGIDWNNAEQVKIQLRLGNNRSGFPESGATRFTGTQTQGLQDQAFVDRYRIVSHHANDATGFSATLIQERGTNNFTLSFRSTEYQPQTSGGDRARDGFGADAEISVGGGFAVGQLLAMENYYQSLKDSGLLPAGAVLNVTGYSLGGHLATVFTELHTDEITHTYTFNGAGRGHITGGSPTETTEAARIAGMLALYKQVLFNPDAGLSVLNDPDNAAYNAAKQIEGQPFTPFVSETMVGEAGNIYTNARYQWAAQVVAVRYQTSSVSFPPGEVGQGPAFSPDKFTQLYGHATQDDTEYVANSGVHGPQQAIYIEDQPNLDGFGGFFGANGDFGTTHSITLIVDSLALQELFQTLSPTLERTQIEAIFAASSNQVASGFVGTAGLAEGNSLENALDALGKLFVPNYTTTQSRRQTGDFGSLGFRNPFYEHLAAVKTALAGATVTIEPFVEMGVVAGQPKALPRLTPGEVVAEAQQDSDRGLACRYALKNLNPFAVIGADYTALGHAANGALTLFDPVTGFGEMTEQYLTDRAAFVEEKIELNLLNDEKSSGNIHFADYVADADDAVGQIRYQIENSVDVQTDQEFLFGSIGLDRLEGRSNDDHIYGGAGVDLLIGNGGNDYLEGDGGGDQLDGGAGIDTLVGGAGNDILEGGSENDTLDGGLDNDILRGGDGLDRYISNFGADTIEDSDGKGVVEFDGQVLLGGLRRNGEPANTFRSADGTLTYTKQGADLVVTGSGPLTIKNFSDGQLSIHFFGEADYGPVTRIEFTKTVSNPSPPPPTTQVPFFDETSNNSNGLEDPMTDSRNNLVHAFGGDDTVISGSGDDQLYGDAGNDLIFGKLGHDRIYGGTGNDNLNGDDSALGNVGGDDFIDGGEGDDLVLGQGGADVLLGGEGNDILNGDDPTALNSGNNDDWLDGGAGDDFLLGAAGADVLIGGLGNDILVGDATVSNGGTPEAGSNDALDGGAGNDQLYGLYGDDLLVGGNGDDYVNGQDGNDVLYGGEGSDRLSGDLRIRPSDGRYGTSEYRGAGGNDLLFGGEGRDFLYGGEGDDQLVGGAGDDELFGEYNENLIPVGDPLYATLRALTGNDWLDGGDGNDELAGGKGDDVLYGGAGNDQVRGEDGNDFVDGGDGDDNVSGGDGNDILLGGSGADILTAGLGNDQLYGGEGNDVLIASSDFGGTGDAHMEGGGGDDRYVIDSAGNTVVESEGGGIDVVQSSISFALGDHVENLQLLGTAPDLHGIGNALDNVLTGGQWLEGKEGNDILTGVARLDGGTGDDRLIGLGAEFLGYVDGVPNYRTNTFMFDRGYGVDTVYDYSVEMTSPYINDVLEFGASITPDDVTWHRSTSDLIFDINGTADEVIVESYFNLVFNTGAWTFSGLQVPGGGVTNLDNRNPYYFAPSWVEQVRFADGTLWDAQMFSVPILGTSGGDTFQFGRGMGPVTVIDFNVFLDPDMVQMASDVAPSDVHVSRVGDSLVLGLAGTADQMTIDSYFKQVFGRESFSFGGRVMRPYVIEEVRFADGTVWSGPTLEDKITVMTGTEGDDVLEGNQNDNVISGLGGSDRLDGGAGNDVLIGGAGNDQLLGREGDNTYRYMRGDGQDIIYNAGSTGFDRLILSDMTPGDITIQATSLYDLDILVNGSTDKIALPGFISGPSRQVDLIEFADGATWTAADVLAHGQGVTQVWTSGRDRLEGTIYNDTLLGLGGRDTLYGFDGNDVLDPGTADDSSYGGLGSDTYIWGRGYGWDEAVEERTNAGDVDVVQVTASVSPNEVSLQADDSGGIVLSLAGTADKLTLSDYYLGEQYRIEEIHFADGTVWDAAAINAMTVGMEVVGTESGETLFGTPLADSLFGLGDDDTLRAWSGADRLVGGAGDDTYRFNLGDGSDTIEDVAAVGEGNRIQFGAGIAQGDLTFGHDTAARTLTIQVGGSGTDQLRLVNFDPAGVNGSLVVSTLQFADGSTVNLADLFPPNHEPTVANPLADQTVPEDAPLSITVPANTFVDQDAGDALTYRATLANGNAMPSWLNFNTTTRTFSGTPDDAQVGSLDVRVTATDSGNLTASDVFTLNVTNVNEAPTVVAPLADQQATEDAAFTLVVPTETFADVDPGDSLTYSATLANGAALPTWLSFSPTTRTFSGTPLNSDVGMLNLAVKATDSNGLSATDSFALTIQNVNDAPTVANPIADHTVLEDAPFSLPIPANTFADQDTIHGDQLTYSASLTDGNALPSWLSFDAAIRTFSGTPDDAQVGGLDLKVTATDDSNLSVSDVFALTVANVNEAPTVAAPLADQTALEDTAFSFTLPAATFADVDLVHGDALTYSASLPGGGTLPAWLSFDPTTRTFSGTPGNGDVGILTVTVTATDSGSLSGSTGFMLVVQNVNDAPTVATPLSDQIAAEDSPFSFMIPNITFTDPDQIHGDVLTYRATLADGMPLPAWLNFDPGTSTFSGTPGPGDAGTLQIAVTATDTVNFGVSDTFTLVISGPLPKTLVGTSGNDVLIGGRGDDTLTGLAGGDLLNGGPGADQMFGGSGDDTYLVDDPGDVVTELANEGVDTVQSSLTYTLGANTENLTLIGATATNATGNALDNILTGNSAANVLDGGVGADTMVGGTGNDTYVVDNVDDLVTESANEGTDIVQSSVSYTLSANLENLTLLGAADIHATGNGQSNMLSGNAGNNVLDGGAGDDTMVGGAGNDTYIMDNFNDMVIENANEGTDTIKSFVSLTLPENVENLILTGTDALSGVGNAQNNVLIGNSAGNVLDGRAGNDTLDGGAGDDILIGGGGSNTLIGGPGDDTFVVTDVGDVVRESAGEGLDTVQSVISYTLPDHVENLLLVGPSVISGIGNEEDNVLTGNSAANLLDGGAGADTMVGGGGDDIYVVDNAGDVVTENVSGGTDTVQSRITYSLAVNVEHLILMGSAAINGTGNALDNVLTGNSAANILTGGAGNDTYVIGVGDTVVEQANQGTDTVVTDQSYTLGAHVENLTLTGVANLNGTGNQLNNILTGNSGNNVLDGQGGADQLVGGAGDDTYLVDNTGDVVTEAASEGIDSVQSSVTYTLNANVENLTLTGAEAINGTGNAGNNILTGNSAANTLDGGAGDDTLLAGAGNDTLLGGMGNDRLDGGTGTDAMTGGTGNDTYVVDAIGDTVTEAANEGTDTVESSITYALGTNLENLTLTGSTALIGIGNALNNVLIGNSLANVLLGGAGDDRLDGGLGFDTMTGGTGDDTYVVDAIGDILTEALNEGIDTVESVITYTLGANVEHLTLTGNVAINGTGNTVNNVLTGNVAANVLTGADGNDTLRGGAGNDTLNGGNGNDAFLFGRGEGQDLVQDTSGTADKLLYDAGINPLDLVISRQANDLRLALHGSTDSVTVQNWYVGTTNRTETIQTGNGQTLLSTQVDQLIQAMAGFSQQSGLTWDQAIDQRPQEVQTVLAASWH